MVTIVLKRVRREEARFVIALLITCNCGAMDVKTSLTHSLPLLLPLGWLILIPKEGQERVLKFFLTSSPIKVGVADITWRYRAWSAVYREYSLPAEFLIRFPEIECYLLQNKRREDGLHIKHYSIKQIKLSYRMLTVIFMTCPVCGFASFYEVPVYGPLHEMSGEVVVENLCFRCGAYNRWVLKLKMAISLSP